MPLQPPPPKPRPPVEQEKRMTLSNDQLDMLIAAITLVIERADTRTYDPALHDLGLYLRHVRAAESMSTPEPSLRIVYHAPAAPKRVRPASAKNV